MIRSSVRGPRVMSIVLLSLVSLCAACGDDDDVPIVEIDGGPSLDAGADAAPDAGQDGGATDLGDDAAPADDLGLADLGADMGSCVDVDGDGYASAACGGDDCDDAQPLVNPGATEVCNADVDDDCDGLADAADGVCVPCPTGYRGTFDADCSDIDECAELAEPCTVTPPARCVNTPGSYACTCPAGYAGDGRGEAGCADVDECLANTDDCDDAPDACINTTGAFSCACPPGFAGSGRGASGCLFDDAALSALVVGPGATLGPAFAPTTFAYSVALAPGATSTTLTAQVARPEITTITLDGAPVLAGATTTIAVGAGFAPRVVSLVVTAESGATRTYTVTLVRRSVYVKSSNADAFDRFATSVALSADGSTLAVGAYLEASAGTGVAADPTNNDAPSAGAVYVFRRAADTWVQEAYVKAANAGSSDRFGWSVALSADGSSLAVGALGEGSASSGLSGDPANDAAGSAGAVYLFTRSAMGGWAQTLYVKASNAEALDQFGWSLALSPDGGTLAVGAIWEASDVNGIGGDQTRNFAAQSGAVYVFRRGVAGSWSQEAYVKASNTGGNDKFGSTVALSANGSRLAVGAIDEASNARGIDGAQGNNDGPQSGAVYVFERDAVSAWRQEAYVKSSNSDVGDQFGVAVALSGDGDTLAVGAYYEDSNARGVGGLESNNSAPESGAAYVFRRSAAGSWSQQAYLKASNTTRDDYFGGAVSLSGDGDTLAVGARLEDSSARGIGGLESDDGTQQAGAVYVFRRAGAAWSQSAYVKASNTGMFDSFGNVVALSGDGETLAVGAIGEGSAARGVGGDETSNAALESGAVYVF
jgi:hypothetical protein